MSVLGVDVYEGDGDIDWFAAYQAGVRYAWIKVTEGDRLDETATAARVRQMRKAGIIPGAYVFLRPRSGRQGAWEAAFALHVCRNIGLYKADHGRTRDLRFALDFEVTGFPDTMIGRHMTRRYLRSAIKEVKRQLGRRPAVYTGAWFADPLGLKPRDVDNCPLWTASYTPTPIVPKAWKEPTWWQFSDTKQIDGIGKCDANYYLAGSSIGHMRANHVF